MSPEATSPAPDPRRIWVTRAQPGAAATAARLSAMGFEPVVEPVVEVRPLKGVAPDPAGVGALAFTSSAGVRAFASLANGRELPVFAVGDATAGAARAEGFTDVRSAGGDAAALAQLIAAAVPRPGCVLCPAAAEPAADLPALLAARGVEARALAVYETRETSPAPPPDRLFAVLIHSAKAAHIVAQRLAGVETSALTVVAISRAAAEPLARIGVRRLAIAARPDEAALLALLEPRASMRRQTRRHGHRSSAPWWLAMALSLAMILAGAIVGFFGPRLFPPRAAALATRPAPAKQPPLQRPPEPGRHSSAGRAAHS